MPSPIIGVSVEGGHVLLLLSLKVLPRSLERLVLVA